MADNIEQRRESIASRFMNLVRTPAPPAPRQTEPDPPSRAQLLAEEIGPWLAKAPAAFWRELDRWAAAAHTTVRSELSDSARVQYALGFEDGIDQVKSKFNEWRGQPAKSGPQGD